jgi:hypothetical protein
MSDDPFHYRSPAEIHASLLARRPLTSTVPTADPSPTSVPPRPVPARPEPPQPPAEPVRAGNEALLHALLQAKQQQVLAADRDKVRQILEAQLRRQQAATPEAVEAASEPEKMGDHDGGVSKVETPGGT